MKGVPENSFSKTCRDTRNRTDKSLGCLHPRLCFFLTKVARISIRYKEKTLIKFSGLQLNNQFLIATSVLKRYPKMLRSRQVWENWQDEDAQCSCYYPLGPSL